MQLPFGELGGVCIISSDEGVSVVVDDAVDLMTGDAIGDAISIELSVEGAFRLGHALLEAAKARGN